MVEYDVPRNGAQRERLCDFLYACIASSPAEQADRLLEAAGMLGAPAATRRRLGAMLACQAYESAALLLIGADQPFLVSRGASGVSIASAMLADGSDEMTAEAATPALALLVAYLSALLADRARSPVRTRRQVPAAAARLH